jgi:hypothetical protein
MGLDETTEKHYREMLPRWKVRQLMWRLPFRTLLGTFWTTGYGPKKIEGPAFVVFDEHSYSPDPLMMARQEGIQFMVARDGKAPLTRIGKQIGAIIVGDRSSYKTLGKRLSSYLNDGQVVGAFPYSDVGNTTVRHGVVMAAMEAERELGVHVKYVAAAVRYHNIIPGINRPFRIGKWPFPFLTKAGFYISDNLFSSEGLDADAKGAKELTARLIEEGSSLPAKYSK